MTERTPRKLRPDELAVARQAFDRALNQLDSNARPPQHPSLEQQVASTVLQLVAAGEHDIGTIAAKVVEFHKQRV